MTNLQFLDLLLKHNIRFNFQDYSNYCDPIGLCKDCLIKKQCDDLYTDMLAPSLTYDEFTILQSTHPELFI